MNSIKEEPFTRWLRLYRPVARQETVIFAAINQIVDDLKWLLTLPNLTDGDKAAIKGTIAKWTAVRKVVVEVAGPEARPTAPAAGNKNGNIDQEHEEGLEHEAPICQVHQLPMVKVRGRRGAFWSCHQRLPDGQFCSYRPGRD